MRTKLTVIALALTFLAGLPLLATGDAPEAQVEQSVKANPATPAVDAETAPATPAESGLESILDDGRQEMSCSQSWCDSYCKTHYGESSVGFCSGGVCYCAF